MKDMFENLNKLNFDDNLGFTLPFKEVNGFDDEDLACGGKVEVTELSPTGDVLDVIDADLGELGKLSASFKVTGLKQALIKRLPKIPNYKKEVIPAHIQAIRMSKAMPSSPSARVVALPKQVHSALFAGTNSRLSTIASLLKKNALSKKVTNEHKTIVKRDNFRKNVLKGLKNIQAQLKQGSASHARTRKACGMP